MSDCLLAIAAGLALSFIAANGLCEQIELESNVPAPYVATANQ